MELNFLWFLAHVWLCVCLIYFFSPSINRNCAHFAQTNKVYKAKIEQIELERTQKAEKKNINKNKNIKCLTTLHVVHSSNRLSPYACLCMCSAHTSASQMQNSAICNRISNLFCLWRPTDRSHICRLFVVKNNISFRIFFFFVSTRRLHWST